MSAYEFKACSLRTGRVVRDLPLVEVSAQRRLDAGTLTARLRLPTALPDATDRADQLAECRDLINATTPGVMTILVIRDGAIMGEWLIWTRDRTTMQLTATELPSWFKLKAAVDGFATLTDVDQLQLAMLIAQNVLAKPLAPPITVSDPGTSGNNVPKAEYPTGTEYAGVILDELGAELNGFDWWVDTAWDTSVAVSAVTRTLQFANPRRGRRLQARIDVAATRPGQSGVAFGLTEDATRIATTVYMTGTGEGDKQLVARGQNPDLFVSYPPLDFIDSRAAYDVQELLDAQAAAVAAANRSPDLPTTVKIRAEGDLQLGSYSPGDIAPLSLEPWSNFPDGYSGDVRIIGFTITPPADGATEFVDVEIQSGDTSAFSA